MSPLGPQVKLTLQAVWGRKVEEVKKVVAVDGSKYELPEGDKITKTPVPHETFFDFVSHLHFA